MKKVITMEKIKLFKKKVKHEDDDAGVSVLNVKVSNREECTNASVIVMALQESVGLEDLKVNMGQTDFYIATHDLIALLKDNEFLSSVDSPIVLRIMSNAMLAMKVVFSDVWEKYIANIYGIQLLYNLLPSIISEGTKYKTLTLDFFTFCFKQVNKEDFTSLIIEDKNNINALVTLVKDTVEKEAEKYNVVV